MSNMPATFVLDMGDNLMYLRSQVIALGIFENRATQIVEETVRQIDQDMDENMAVFSSRLRMRPTFDLFLSKETFDFNPHAKITMSDLYKRTAMAAYFAYRDAGVFAAIRNSIEQIDYILEGIGPDYIHLKRYP